MAAVVVFFQNKRGGGVVLEPFLYHRLEDLVPVSTQGEFAIVVTEDLGKAEV